MFFVLSYCFSSSFANHLFIFFMFLHYYGWRKRKAFSKRQNKAFKMTDRDKFPLYLQTKGVVLGGVVTFVKDKRKTYETRNRQHATQKSQTKAFRVNLTKTLIDSCNPFFCWYPFAIFFKYSCCFVCFLIILFCWIL